MEESISVVIGEYEDRGCYVWPYGDGEELARSLEAEGIKVTRVGTEEQWKRLSETQPAVKSAAKKWCRQLVMIFVAVAAVLSLLMAVKSIFVGWVISTLLKILPS